MSLRPPLPPTPTRRPRPPNWPETAAILLTAIIAGFLMGYLVVGPALAAATRLFPW